MSASIGNDGPGLPGPAPTASQPPPGPPPLRRRRDERMLVGVASALARRLMVDPLVVRLAFVILVPVGGVGLLAYLAGWLLIPQEGDAEGEGPPRSRVALAAGVGLAVVALGVLLGLPFWLPLPLVLLAGAVAAVAWWLRSDPTGRAWNERHALVRIGLALALVAATLVLAVGAAFATAAGAGRAMAAVVIGLGLLAAVLAVGGRRWGRWLVVPAIMVGLSTGLVLAAGLQGVGEQQHRPATPAALEDDYELAVGEVLLDLRTMRLGTGERVPVSVRVGVGRVGIAVPPGVCVVGRAEAGVGVVTVQAAEREGFGATVLLDGAPAAATPVIELDVRVDLGGVEVGTGDPRGPFDEYDREDTPDACAAPVLP